MIRYAKITLIESRQTFYLRIAKETPKVVTGFEVNQKGDEIQPRGFERRFRIIEKALILFFKPCRMNNFYAELEEIE